MKSRVVIVDYGVGNLYSVQRAVEVSGNSEVLISGEADEIASADKIILPGVGAFKDGINELQDRGLIEVLSLVAEAGKPILGICLGMQLMATSSEEFGMHKGLNLIPGNVVKIPNKSTDGKRLKVPYVGWAPLNVGGKQRVTDTCIDRIGREAVYLVHSFQFVPENLDHQLATYNYGGHHITAAVQYRNITGLQFHPEKSGHIGIKIMRDFVGQNG